jgi:hypothetical protein
MCREDVNRLATSTPAWTETEDPSYRFGSVRIDLDLGLFYAKHRPARIADLPGREIPL